MAEQTTNTSDPAPVASPELNRSTRGIWIAIAIVGVAVLVLAGVFGYGVVTKRLDGAKGIDRAQALIQQADVTVIKVDRVVAAEVTTESAAQAAEVTPTISAASDKLAEAVRLLGAARASATEDEQERADLLSETAQQRIEMLKQAPTILDTMVKASSARALGADAWQRASSAEQYSDQAVELFNKLNTTAAKQSAELDVKAKADYVAARDLMGKAQAAFPEAKFAAFLGYLDAKIAQVDVSKQATAAYLAGDTARANSLATSFNTEDKRLVEVAKTLPTSTGEVVAEAYDQVTKAATDAYYAARDKATKADTSLRTK